MSFAKIPIGPPTLMELGTSLLTLFDYWSGFVVNDRLAYSQMNLYNHDTLSIVLWPMCEQKSIPY